MIMQDVDATNSCCYKALVAKKTRGQFSLSQDIKDEIARYVEKAGAEGRDISKTAVVEAGALAFFRLPPELQDAFLSVATRIGLAKNLPGLAAQSRAGDHTAQKRKVVGKG